MQRFSLNKELPINERVEIREESFGRIYSFYKRIEVRASHSGIFLQSNLIIARRSTFHL